IASALTTSPSRRSARARPRSDLPVAVGPTTATTVGPSRSDKPVVVDRGVEQGVAVLVVVVVAERVTVDARHPGVARLAPAVGADRLACPPGLLVVEPVDVKQTVEVVELVLHHPREPAGRPERQRLAVRVAPDHAHLVGPLEGVALPWDGQTALALGGRSVTNKKNHAKREHQVDAHAPNE